MASSRALFALHVHEITEGLSTEAHRVFCDLMGSNTAFLDDAFSLGRAGWLQGL